ncbi:MAG: alpha/beta fold hydrolase [Ignavibacteriales bacterium]|nr:alpha/beta fold hydrolase [Ignavibacteriales bacterium]
MQTFDPVTEDQPHDPDFPASMAPLVFVNHGCRLFGTMFIASGEGLHPVIILLHGSPGNETSFDLAHVFRRQGFNVFVFHYRGCWGSEGDYSWGNLLDDTSAAIDFMKSETVRTKFRVDGSKIILIGHSMGGFSALYNSLPRDEIKNAAAISVFDSGSFGEILEINKEIFDYSIQTIEPAIPFLKNTSALKLLNECITNKVEWNLLNHLDELLHKNILMIGAKHDMIAPVELHHIPLVGALKLLKAPDVEDHILETGHSYSDKRIELAGIISNWLNRIKW